MTKRWLVFCFPVVCLLALLGTLVAAKPQGRAATAAVAVTLTDRAATEVGGAPAKQVARGHSIFALRCAVCHGDTGGGLEEARLAFPEDHRRCESCHKPGNPDLQVQMGSRSFESMRGRSVVGNAFAVGAAPALNGPGSLAAFRDAGALQAYIRVAMPRHAPGTLNDEQSYALTAFILDLNRVLPEVALNRKNAAQFRLR